MLRDDNSVESIILPGATAHAEDASPDSVAEIPECLLQRVPAAAAASTRRVTVPGSGACSGASRERVP